MNGLQTNFINDLTQYLSEQEQADCPVIHRFEKGFYIRELHVKAGVCLVGRFHLQANINILVKGKVQLIDPDGVVSMIEAPLTFIGSPGQKAAFVLEDMIWQNIYKTEHTTVEQVEAEVLKPAPVFTKPTIEVNSAPALVFTSGDSI